MIMIIHPCLIFSQVSRRLMKVSVLSSANAMYLIVVMKNSLFYITNRRRERMYREGSGEF